MFASRGEIYFTLSTDVVPLPIPQTLSFGRQPFRHHIEQAFEIFFYGKYRLNFIAVAVIICTFNAIIFL